MAVANPLPPGSNGLPVLGETLAFASNPFGFVDSVSAGRASRRFPHQHPRKPDRVPGRPETRGDLHRSSQHPARRRHACERHGALFGGNPDIVPLLDGEAHAQRKRSLLAAFSREAVASYLPSLQRRIETLIAEWLAQGEGPVTADLKTPSRSSSLAGASPRSRSRERQRTRLLADNAILGSAFVALPINLPGTAYSNGLKAHDRDSRAAGRDRSASHRFAARGAGRSLAHPRRGEGSGRAARRQNRRARNAPLRPRGPDRLRRTGGDTARAPRAPGDTRTPARGGA